MAQSYTITPAEKAYLRELAFKCLEYANLPIMEERRRLWLAHNACKGERPPIIMEMTGFAGEMLPKAKCVSPVAQDIEWNLQSKIIKHELIDDDSVISPFYSVPWNIGVFEFGLQIPREHAVDNSGKTLGFSNKHPIQDLKTGLSLLKPFTFSIDKEGTLAKKHFVETVLGDILPARIANGSLNWFVTPSEKIVRLMGLENMMCSMALEPDEMHVLYAYLAENIKAFLRWQEKEGLLIFNNGNDYIGSGSVGFTTELPPAGLGTAQKVLTKHLWGNLNSQETVSISPDMYHEFVFPCYQELAREFGLVYYGCCEPVHSIWERSVSKYHGLKKVSISPWCDENFMGQALSEKKVIYSRKPSPNFIGVGEVFNESAFREHIAKTLMAAKNCCLEFIFRDTYTLCGDITKPGRAVKIVRELINKTW